MCVPAQPVALLRYGLDHLNGYLELLHLLTMNAKLDWPQQAGQQNPGNAQQLSLGQNKHKLRPATSGAYSMNLGTM